MVELRVVPEETCEHRTCQHFPASRLATATDLLEIFVLKDVGADGRIYLQILNVGAFGIDLLQCNMSREYAHFLR